MGTGCQLWTIAHMGQNAKLAFAFHRSLLSRAGASSSHAADVALFPILLPSCHCRQFCRHWKKSAGMTVPQVRQLLQVVLPKRTLDAETVLELIEQTQRQNYAAYRAHQRATQRRLDSS